MSLYNYQRRWRMPWRRRKYLHTITNQYPAESGRSRRTPIAVRHVPSALSYTARPPTFHNATHHSTLRSGCWVVGLQYKPHRPTTAHRRVNERPKSHHRKPALTKTYAHSNLVSTDVPHVEATFRRANNIQHVPTFRPPENNMWNHI